MPYWYLLIKTEPLSKKNKFNTMFDGFLGGVKFYISDIQKERAREVKGEKERYKEIFFFFFERRRKNIFIKKQQRTVHVI